MQLPTVNTIQIDVCVGALGEKQVGCVTMMPTSQQR